MLNEAVDSHAPLKKRVIKTKTVPYMNDCLRRSINVKDMLRRRYEKDPTKINWETYRKQRNMVTANRKNSIQMFIEKNVRETTHVGSGTL